MIQYKHNLARAIVEPILVVVVFRIAPVAVNVLCITMSNSIAHTAVTLSPP